MRDYLIRATAMEGKVRAFAVRATGIVDEIRRRHEMTPTATAAVGRTVAAGLMMGAMLKGEEKLTILVRGGGPIGQIVVDANARGDVRGYADNPHVDLPLNEVGKLDVAGAVGRDGFLNIIKDLGLKEPYRGSIPIISGELAEDFTYYFAKSEQTPSAVALGVLVGVDFTVTAAGGFVIQLLPGLTDDEIGLIELQLSRIAPITTMLEAGMELEDILHRVLPEVQVLENMGVQFRCKCSKQRVQDTLVSLGRAELQQILEEDGKTEVVCHFCNETYHFGEEDLTRLIAQM
ncbi:Hsp33 family molecular chaperone HslO [Paenibacillus xerothermodurans]|uniref:33 kDa chaperonin n=1 Tax=Paenibacillus xerothermodurans TaxID=1977292 RepID=A0A2W1N4D8_PAEXE|nr:Hsp33 family molecular chaperone HslO [Paenibacillus xerothermodurans]PZE19227.1 Hsp33 family molecular chaperone HslO [Paenibacillus xerothermodurans]